MCRYAGHCMAALERSVDKDEDSLVEIWGGSIDSSSWNHVAQNQCEESAEWLRSNLHPNVQCAGHYLGNRQCKSLITGRMDEGCFCHKLPTTSTAQTVTVSHDGYTYTLTVTKIQLQDEYFHWKFDWAGWKYQT